MDTINREQWNTEKRHGYASIDAVGQRKVLRPTEFGTYNVPVLVEGLPALAPRRKNKGA